MMIIKCMILRNKRLEFVELKRRRFFVGFLILCYSLLVSYDLHAKVEWLYVSYIDDPTRTVMVRWNSLDGDTKLYYKKQGKEKWDELMATGEVLHPKKIALYSVELTGLEPQTTYEMRIGENPKVYTCKTLSQEPSSLRFIVGGDVYRSLSLMNEMNALAASYDPDFVVLGGDLAYAKPGRFTLDELLRESERWYTFFQIWEKHMVRSDGHVIPLITTLGNHDVGLKKGDERELFYTKFFRKKEVPSYQVLDVGKSISIFLLDTGHIEPIQGAQTNWLKESLEKREDVSTKIAVYHIAAYPSVYAYDGKTAKKIRECWCPLFEQYGVEVAFENHNHAYKRTYPIKEEKVDPEGVLYMGDGAWAVPVRSPKKAKDVWYLEKSFAKNYFSLVSMENEKMLIQSIDIDGNVFDEVSLSK